jgi:hypothetical protein
MSRGGRDDDVVTLRLSRRTVALVQALVLHGALLWLVSRLPDPPRPQQRIEVTVRRPPPPPSPSPSPSPSSPSAPVLRPSPLPPVRPPPPATPAQPFAPVLPALPPSPVPPDNAAVLPLVERAPDPLLPVAPPASSSSSSSSSLSWREQLLASLGSPARPAGDVLPPSFAALDRVAGADARLHDDKNEERLIVDYGPFFRRGLEALRARWHPDEVLGRGPRDEVQRCAREPRTTLGIAVIDRDGDVVDVELKASSGCPPLDTEALAAFRRVGRFDYPPAGLFVDGNGEPTPRARLPVRFIVTFDGRVELDWR